MELLRLLAFSVVYYLAIESGSVYAYQTGDLAVVWPPSGIFLAALLTTERRAWIYYIAAFGAIQFYAEQTASTHLLISSVSFTLALIVEAVLSAYLLRRKAGGEIDFASPDQVTHFVVVCCVGVVSFVAIPPAIINMTFYGASFVDSWWNWAVADAIGMLVMTPLIVGFCQHKKLASPKVLAAVLAAVLGLVWLIYAINDSIAEYRLPQFMYLLIPFLTFAAFRFQAYSVAVITFVAFCAVIAADFMLALGSDDDARLASALDVQGYLFFVLMVPLIVTSIVWERRRLFTDQQERLGRMETQREALTSLSRMTTLSGRDPDSILRSAVELAATALGVERIGLWRLEGGNQKLVGDYLFAVEGEVHSSGEVLLREDFPAYFESVERGSVIAAHDAMTDPRTSEFAESYLAPNGISAMIDSFVSVPGYYEGVLCCEEVSMTPRVWQADEIGFVTSVAEHIARLLTERVALTLESQQRDVERELARVEKMDSLEQLTRVVAHDYNNLMAVIVGQAEILKFTLTGDELRAVESIGVAADRGSDLSQKLMNQARTAIATSTVDVAAVIHTVATLLDPNLGANVRLVSESEPGLWVDISGGELQDSLMNLCMNSIYAMRREGGTLRIHAASEERVVKVTIADEGEGISRSIADKIFEPYFTTKGKDGNGIGLSQVKTLIEEAGGAVDISSQQGVGTSTTISLPRAARPEPE